MTGGPSLGRLVFDIDANRTLLDQKLAQARTDMAKQPLRLALSIDPNSAKQELQKAVSLMQRQTVALSVKLDTRQAQADLRTLRVAPAMTVNLTVRGVGQAINDVKAFQNLLSGLGQNMNYRVTVNVTALNAVYAQIQTQIVSLQSLISQLRSLGGSGGAGGGRGPAGGAVSAATRQMLSELEALNNQWKRGEIGAQQFGADLTALQAKLRTAAGAATAGTAEFRALDAGLTRLQAGLRSINTDTFQKIKTDIGAMRAAFDAATAGVSRNSQQYQAATAAYGASTNTLIGRLQSLAASGTLTTQQLGQVNREMARLAREANTIAGGINHAGLSGSVVNSFAALGGQFGVLAFQGMAVATMFRSVQAAAGGAGLALAAVAGGALVAVGGLFSLGSTGLKEIQKTEQGLNVLQANGVKDLDAIQESVKGLQKSLGAVSGAFSRSDLTVALGDTVKAGLNADESLKLMATSARLAAAENINLNDATQLLLKNIRQYGGSVDDAARTGDMLAKAGNLAAGSANDLSIGLGIVGTTGKQAKIEMYDLLGMLVELDNKGMSAADVGANGLRAAIAALGDPTEKARGILKGLNIEVDDAAGKARPAGDIMVELGAKMRDMGIVVNKSTGELSGNGEALRTVAGIMDNRAAAAVLGLAGDWRGYGQEVKNSNAYLDEYATTMSQGVASALRSLRTAWRDSGEAFAKSFAKPLADFLNDTLNPTVLKLSEMFEIMSKPQPEIKASLKITAEDDLTSFILKFLGGAVQATKEVLAIPTAGLPNQEEIAKIADRYKGRGGAMESMALRNDLVRVGLLPELSGAAARAQLEDITKNFAKYADMWAEAIRAGSKGIQDALTPGNSAVQMRNLLGIGTPTFEPPASDLKKGQQQFSYEFISQLGAVMKNDPRVASDCAIIAYEILRHMGVAIKGSATENAWTPSLEKNAKAAGFTQVANIKDVKPGDLVIFKTGNGISYGAGSGMHAGVAATDYSTGNRKVTDNPGTLSNGQDGVTRTRDIGADAMNATFYRAPNSPWANGASSAQDKPASPAAITKSFDAYVAEARRILGQVEKYAGSGSAPDPEKWRKATATLEKFREQSELTAQAVAYVGTETKKAADKASQYGQTFDTLKGKLDITQSLEKLGRPASDITKNLQSITTQAREAAEAEKKRNGETAKYRALLDLAGDAAARLKTLESKKPEQTPLQREQAALAEARAQEALEKAIRGASRARLDTIISGGVQKEGDLNRVKLAEAELKRRGQLSEEQARKAAQAVRDNAELSAKLAKETAQAAERRAQEIQQQAARVNEAVRQNNVTAAREELTRLEAMRQKDLDGAKDSAAERYRIERVYADQIYNARKAVLDKERADRDADIRNSDLPAKVKAAQLKTSQATYDNGLTAAANARDKFLTDSDTALTEAAAKFASDTAKAWTDGLIEGLRDKRTDEALSQKAAEWNANLAKSLNDNLLTELRAERNAVEDSLRDYGGVAKGVPEMRPSGLIVDGEDIYLTEDEIRRMGQTTEATTETFFNLEEAIENAGKMGRDELAELIRLSKLGADEAIRLWEAWGKENPVDLGKQLEGIMQAQSLMDRLEAASDPVEIQAITGQIADFLASDVGEILPDGVKQGLTDGVEGAKEFAGILTGITANAVADGLQDAVTRTNGAKLPENRFKEFFDQIMAGDFDLSNPEILKGLYEGLDISLKAGELTTDQLETLKVVIDSINNAPLLITGKDSDAAALENTIGAITSRIDEAQASYESGAIGADEYNAALIEQEGALLKLLVSLERLGPAGEAGAASVRLLLAATTASIDPAHRLAEELGTLADDKAVELTKQAVALRQSFADGATTLSDFTDEAVKSILNFEKLADAAERAGRFDLGAHYRAMAADLREAGGAGLEAALKLARLAEETQKLETFFSKFSKSAEAAGSIAKSIGGLFGDAGREFGSAMSDFFSSGLKGAEGIARVMANPADIEGWAKAIGGVLGYYEALGKMIDSFNPKLKALRKEMLETAAAEREAMGSRMVGGRNGFLNPFYDALKEDADALTKKANAGFWQRLGWSLFGGAPETLDKAASESLQKASSIFNEFGSSLYNDLSSALMDAINQGDFSKINDVLKVQLDKFVQKAAIDALIAKSNLAPLIEELATTSAAGGDTSGVMARIRAEESRIAGQVEAIAPSLPGYGAGAATGGSGAPGGALFGNAPGVQLGIPRLEISLPEIATRGFTDFAGAVPVFSEASSRMLQAANLLLSLDRGRGGPPPLSGLGGLV